MNKIISSNIKITVDGNLKVIWELVTSLDNYSWRSDLKNIKVVDDKTFIECSKDGYETVFTVTNMEPCKIWEFDMKNSNMSGHWIGKFTDTGNGVELDFTETVDVTKMILAPIAKIYLRIQQKKYVRDLRAEISKNLDILRK